MKYVFIAKDEGKNEWSIIKCSKTIIYEGVCYFKDGITIADTNHLFVGAGIDSSWNGNMQTYDSLDELLDNHFVDAI